MKRKKYSTGSFLLPSGLGLVAMFFFLPLGSGWTQSPSPIKKSEKIETIDGKKFYIHPVEKGQTLYSIAKTYGTTVDIVLVSNPDAVDGLRPGDKLKIPYSGNTDVIKKEIESKATNAGTPKKETPVKSARIDSSEKHLFTGPKNEVPVSALKKDSAGIPMDNIKPIGDIHVALFLPLDLAAVESIDVAKIAQGDEKLPDDTRSGIEFYEGFKLAFDSLKKQGFKGAIHVYDSNLDSAAFDKLLKKAELKEMDLIIGPLYGKRFDLVLKFAKANNINIVSPSLQGNNMLLGNPNTSKVTPSYVTQTEALALYAAANYSGQNIMLFNSANPKDRAYLNTFKRTANPVLQQAKADTVKEITFATLKNFISKTKVNVVAIPSTNPSFVTEAVNKLFLDKQENKDSIIVLGLSNFRDIESLDFGYLNALHSCVSAYSFTDYSSAFTKNFILKYRSEFKTEPSDHVFSGFDIGYYYLKGLQQFGNGLQRKLPELKEKGIQTEFSFYQSDKTSGYENKGVGILKFENYSYTRVK